MGLSPEQAKKLLEGNNLNLVKKVTGGTVLSLKEVEMLETLASAAAETPKGPSAEIPKQKTLKWANNQVELAAALGMDRKTVQRWAKDADAPGPRSNGKYKVEEWRQFGEERGHEFDDDLNQTQLRAKQILIQNKLLEHKYAVARGEYVPVIDVEAWTGDMIAQAKKILLGGPPSLAPQIVGVSIPEAEKLLRTWLHDALAMLSASFPKGGKS